MTRSAAAWFFNRHDKDKSRFAGPTEQHLVRRGRSPGVVHAGDHQTDANHDKRLSVRFV